MTNKHLVQFSHGTLAVSDDISQHVNEPHVDHDPNPDELVNPFSDGATKDLDLTQDSGAGLEGKDDDEE